MWNRTINNNTQAEISAELSWSDETKTHLTATGKVRFLKDIQHADYRLSFALVADGLNDDKWHQSNYYNDYELTGEYAEPYWNLFVGQPSEVAGLIFNDVVVYYPDIIGIEGSLPETIEAEKWYEYKFEINPEDVTNLQGQHIVKDFNKTRVVAILVKGKGGKPINCISSTYPDGNIPDGIESVESDREVVATEYFDFSGMRVRNPKSGFYIRKDRFSDNSINVTKIHI